MPNRAASASAVAQKLYDWAKANGAAAGKNDFALEHDIGLVFPSASADDRPKIAAALRRLKVVAITADDAARSVVVLTKNQVSDRAEKSLPDTEGEVSRE